MQEIGQIINRISRCKFHGPGMKITSGGCLLFSAIIFIVFVAVTPLSAEEVKVELGRLEMVPSIDYRAEYQDNIYAQEADKKEDIVHVITPGIAINYYGAPGNYLKMGYSLDVSKYMDHDDVDYITHAPFISAGWDSSSGLYIRAKDAYRKTDDPFGTENSFRQGVPQTGRWKNNANLVIGYRFLEKYALEAILGNYMERFDRRVDQWQDYTNLRYGAAVRYYSSQKVSLFAEFDVMEGEYDKQNNGIMQGGSAWSISTSQDYQLYNIYVGAQFKPGNQWSGLLKLGYGIKDFVNTFNKDGYRYKDSASWVADTLLTYTPRPGTNIELGLGRSQLGAPDNQALSFVDTRASLKLKQNLTRQISFTLGFAQEYDDYIDEIQGIPEKYFQVYEITAGFDVKLFKWLTTGLRYEYESKKASDRFYAAEEYDRSILGFIINMTL